MVDPIIITIIMVGGMFAPVIDTMHDYTQYVAASGDIERQALADML